jgi:hypothetical protein
MPQPTASDVHVNAPLTNVSVAWLQDESNFIADKMFRPVPVKKQSDLYFTYSRGQWFTAKAKKRAPSTESAGSGYDLTSTGNYYCDVYALHKDVDDQIRANADAALDVDTEATEFVTRDLVLKREITWATDFFTTGVWTGSTSGTDVTPAPLWDAVGSTPITDMREQLTALKRRTSFRGNVVGMGEEVWAILQDHPDFTDRIKYTQVAIVTTDLLASVLGVEEVLIGGSVQNLAVEGATENMQFIFGKNVLIMYRPPRPGLMTPAAGYTFAWVDLFGANSAGGRVSRFRMEHLRSDRVEGEMSYDQKLVASEMGAFLSAVIS